MSKIILMLSQYVPGLKKAFEEKGYKIVEDRESIIDLEKTNIREKLIEWKNKENVTHVFSMNFSPDVAEYCFKYSIIYISWIVDSPHPSLLNKNIQYPTNRVFIFDYVQWKELYSTVEANVYYLPLAADVDLLWTTINNCTEEQKNKYLIDVSFMGSLYDSPPNNMYDQIKYLPPYVRGYLEGLMKAQMMIWGRNLVHTCLLYN